MRHFVCSILIQLFFISVSHAVVLELANPPGNYRIFAWSGKTVSQTGTYTRDVSGYKFTIPDQYVVKKGEAVDIKASLRKWRSGTPAADGNPRTRNGIGYYPFTDSTGKQQYVALEHINERLSRFQGTTLTSAGSTVEPVLESASPPPAPKPKPETEPEAKPASPADVGSMPSKSKCSDTSNSKMCMMCNCFYEASTESDLGMQLVARVVLTRMQHKNYPRTACGVIHQRNRSGAQFSWTPSSRKRNSTIPRNAGEVATYNKCSRNVAQAYKDGGNFAVHYHATYVNPKWARKCPVLKREKAHIFYRDCDDRSGRNWAHNIDPTIAI